jgi:hypothetical protein
MAAEATVRKMKAYLKVKKGIKNSSNTSSLITESIDDVSSYQSDANRN